MGLCDLILKGRKPGADLVSPKIQFYNLMKKGQERDYGVAEAFLSKGINSDDCRNLTHQANMIYRKAYELLMHNPEIIDNMKVSELAEYYSKFRRELYEDKLKQFLRAIASRVSL